ncbi:hypothetical protein E1301_Tti022800 [Triplophysa tibetana]|uniref:Ig-like domain-containing protein n=1 Tax=Triplophysa tibetana TaxID=1572043 RepID=A0A5A9PG04_9TELE|nr:hypothetical protein E1301_Tti022800 [Triplophysa tibetana]
MTEKSDICLLGLILLSSLFTGVSEAEETDVFISSGESVSLSCNDSLHQCSSTTWMYSNYITSSAVEVFTGGIKKKNTKRSERLSLTSDCSLNIYKITQHDGGLYTCRQYVNGSRHGPDSYVLLHVLHVSSSSSSSSSSQTEIRANTSVTLTCQLFSYECDHVFRVDGFQLVWMNQTDVDRQTDSRYQIRSDKLCLISLTTTLVNEDDNTELRCVLKHKNDIKTSVTYTVRFTDSNKILVTTANPERFSTPNTPETTQQQQQQASTTTSIIIRVILVIVEVSVFAAPTVILLQIICAGRAQNRRRTQNAHQEDTVMSAVLE